MQVVLRVSLFVMFCVEMQQLQVERETRQQLAQIIRILEKPAGAWFEGWCKNQHVLPIHFFNSISDRCQEMFLPGLKIWDELKLELLHLRRDALRPGTHTHTRTRNTSNWCLRRKFFLARGAASHVCSKVFRPTACFLAMWQLEMTGDDQWSHVVPQWGFNLWGRRSTRIRMTSLRCGPFDQLNQLKDKVCSSSLKIAVNFALPKKRLEFGVLQSNENLVSKVALRPLTNPKIQTDHRVHGLHTKFGQN